MNENVILERIIEDANIESKHIIDSANVEIENLKNNLVDFDNSLKQKYELEIDKFKEKNQEYYESNLEFSDRKLSLEVKNNVINDLKNKAYEKIINFSKSEMLEFIEKILVQNAEKNEILYYNIDNIGDDDLAGLETVKNLNLLIIKNAEIEKGLLISTKIYDKNLSFKNLIQELFNKKQKEIFEVLF